MSSTLSRGLQAETIMTVPIHKQIDITVVWGVRSAKSTPWVGAIEESMMWSYDPTFDLSNPWAQRAVRSLCEEYPAGLLIVSSKCWIMGYILFLEDLGEPFPSRDFNVKVLAWFPSTIQASENLWVVDGKIAAAKVSFRINVAEDQPARTVLSHKEDWDAFLSKQNGQASFTAKNAFHTAKSWVRAEAELAIVNSTIMTILIAASAGFLGMLFFTGDPTLAFLVLLLVLGVVSGLSFFMVTLMKWKLGPVEVIALVVFVGYSVTYSLHVAHLYNEARPGDNDDCKVWPALDNQGACRACSGVGCGLCREKCHQAEMTFPELRRSRTRAALLRVGGATVSSAISTMGSSSFLLFCTLRIFTKLGAVVIAVTVLSCVAALVSLPAALVRVGPGPNTWYWRLARRCCPPLVRRLRKYTQPKLVVCTACGGAGCGLCQSREENQALVIGNVAS